MGNTSDKERTNKMTPVGSGYYNLRTNFKVLSGFLDIGTHMSFIKLSNGKYLLIDTVPLDEHIKKEINELTNNGQNIEAVVATHPFHSLSFPAFYKTYPNAPYYGTPRHIKLQTDIPWAGDIMNNLCKWAPDVQMRIPAGAEFVSPQPESFNHFASVWVFSPEARTIHVDDTISYIADAPPTLFKLAGKKTGEMEFHLSIRGPGLYPTEEAPVQFKKWIEAIIRDWDFDNICCAHVGRRIGGGKDLLAQTLENTQPLLDKLIKKNRGKSTTQDADDGSDCAKYNIEGTCECG